MALGLGLDKEWEDSLGSEQALGHSDLTPAKIREGRSMCLTSSPTEYTCPWCGYPDRTWSGWPTYHSLGLSTKKCGFEAWGQEGKAAGCSEPPYCKTFHKTQTSVGLPEVRHARGVSLSICSIGYDFLIIGRLPGMSQVPCFYNNT